MEKVIDLKKSDTEDIFKRAIYFSVHPSHWHHWIGLWITEADWVEFCSHTEYWQQFYPKKYAQ